MAKLISAVDISDAWLQAMEHLLTQGGKDENLIVAVAATASGGVRENVAVRNTFDEFLAAHENQRIRRIRKVADTIFPIDFYRSGPGKAAREHLYKMQARATKVERRFIKQGTYFDRLIDWQGETSTKIDDSRNQLERCVQRLQGAWNRGVRNQSSNQLALSHESSEDLIHAEDPSASLRIYDPLRNRSIMGFPCLSHINVTLFQGRLNLSATYRNQHFITKAYGNFLGLADLQRFVAAEVDCPVGELVCFANHADAEIDTPGVGKVAIEKLLHRCRVAMTRTAQDGEHS